MELKQEGKLKPKSNQPQSSTTDNEFSLSDTPADRMRKEREKLKNRSVADEYAEKIGSKFGGRRGKQVGRMLGIDVPTTSSTQTETTTTEKRKPKLGAIEMDGMDDDDEDEDQLYQETEDERRERMVISSEAASDAIDMLRRNVDEDEDDETGDDEMDEEEMLDVVAKALARKGFSSASGLDLFAESESPTASSTVATSTPAETLPNVVSSTVSTGVKTSSVGGSWSPPQDEQTKEDEYQPKVGTWGAFPRPRNISVAYGGGKRVGAGVKTDKQAQQQSIESTKDRLRAYREKMGIEVQSEKDNEAVIEEALQLASRAMQRGSYGIGVSALEKVTQYCSTKVSKELSFCFLFISMYINLHHRFPYSQN